MSKKDCFKKNKKGPSGLNTWAGGMEEEEGDQSCHQAAMHLSVKVLR